MVIVVNDLTFSGFKSLKLYLQNILYKYDINESLSNTDLEFFISLMKQTEHGKNKIGSGVIKITVEPGVYGSRGFTLYRADGSIDDFSYIKIIPCTDRQRYHIQKRKVMSACRYLVRDKPKQKGNQFHHEGKLFAQIFNDFLDAYHLTIDDIELTDNNNIHNIKSIKDKNIVKKFIKFHNKRAKLVEVTPEEHRIIHANEV